MADDYDYDAYVDRCLEEQAETFYCKGRSAGIMGMADRHKTLQHMHPDVAPDFTDVGRQLGIVAKKDIPAGTVIFAEKPLVGITSSEIGHDEPANDSIEDAVVRTSKLVTKMIETLSPEDLVQVASSLLPQRLEEHPIYRKRGDFISEAVESVELSSKNPRVDAILVRDLVACLLLNGHWLSPQESKLVSVSSYGIYMLGSLVNHSCQPNACHYWDPNADAANPVLMVRTIEPVKAGQEITISYVEIAQPPPNRRAITQFNHCFVCMCPGCFGGRFAKLKQLNSVNDISMSPAHHELSDEITELDRQSSSAEMNAANFTRLEEHYSRWLARAKATPGMEDTYEWYLCLHFLAMNGTYVAVRAEALALFLPLAEAVYPPNWPTLTTYYRRAFDFYEAIHKQEEAATMKDKFNRTRDICRGPRCSSCRRFLITPLRCARCKKAAYCAQGCQRKDWPVHKKTCAPPGSQPGAAQS